jgi:hypothetical protein
MTSPQSRHVQVLGKVVQGLFHRKPELILTESPSVRVDNYWSKMRRFGKYWDLKFHDPEVLLLIDEKIMRRYRMGKDINIEVLSQTFPP